MNQSYAYEQSSLTFRDFLNKVFVTMSVGLGISALCAWLVSRYYYELCFRFGRFMVIGTLAVCVLELAVGIFFSARIRTMSKGTARFCYVFYSILTGLSLAGIIAGYTDGSVVMALVTTTVVFISMAVIGNNSKIDFSHYGNLLWVGLLSSIIMTILNIFIFRSNAINLIITYISIALFLGLVAFDIQNLRNLYIDSLSDSELNEKLMIMGSFQLYLDFINLFIRILEIFGKRNND